MVKAYIEEGQSVSNRDQSLFFGVFQEFSLLHESGYSFQVSWGFTGKKINILVLFSYSQGSQISEIKELV